MSYTIESMKGSILFKHVSMWLAHNAAQRTANLMSSVEGLIALLAALPPIRQTFSPKQQKPEASHRHACLKHHLVSSGEVSHYTKFWTTAYISSRCTPIASCESGLEMVIDKLDPRVKCCFFITALAWWMSWHWVSSELLTHQLRNSLESPPGKQPELVGGGGWGKSSKRAPCRQQPTVSLL